MYREHPPGPGLRPYVACYWTLRSDRPAPHRVLPDGCLDLIVDVRRARIVAVGAMTTAILADDHEVWDTLGVRFRPGEAAAWIPSSALTDQTVPLDDLWGPSATELAERVAASPDEPARFRILDEVLMARLGDRWADWRVRRAIAVIEADPGRVAIRRVAAEVGLGERQLERLFVDRVGLGPKRFARVMRVQRAVASLAGADLATVAVVCGFSDPSHVVREIRALCGVTPSVLAAERAMSVPSNRPSAEANTGPTIGGERW